MLVYHTELTNETDDLSGDVTDIPENTVTYVVDEKTIEKLHTGCLRYKLLYQAACRRLKECRTAGQMLDDKLGRLSCQNRVLTMEQYRLQTELDMCYKSKTVLQNNLLYVFRSKIINISEEQVKRRAINNEKRELKLLQERMLLQEVEFQRLERGDTNVRSSNVHPSTSVIDKSPQKDTKIDLPESKAGCIAAQKEADLQVFNLKLSLDKMELETLELQNKLDSSNKINDELQNAIATLEENRENLTLDIQQRNKIINAQNDKLSDLEQEKAELAEKEQSVLKICERERNMCNTSLEKCRESLFQKEDDLKQASESIEHLKLKLSSTNQDLKTEREAVLGANQMLEGEKILLKKKYDNLMIECARFTGRSQELTRQNDHLQSELSSCRDELQRFKNLIDMQRSSNIDSVNNLLKTIEQNNSEYLEKQKEYNLKIPKLEYELKQSQSDYRQIKKEKNQILENNEKLELQVTDLTRNVTDLEKLKDYVNRFISENYSFITNLDIPSSLSKISTEYRNAYERLDKVEQLYETTKTKYEESSTMVDHYKKISEEQSSQLDAIKVTLDELRSENVLLKTKEGNASHTISSPSIHASPRDYAAKRLSKLKRYYHVQLASKREEISKLIKKVHNLRRDLAEKSRVVRPVKERGPRRGDSCDKEMVVLEMELLRIRDENRAGFRDLSKGYQILLDQSAAERQKLNDELDRLRDTNGFRALMCYYSMLIDYVWNAVAAMDTESCPEELANLMKTVRDFRDYNLTVSQLRSLYTSPPSATSFSRQVSASDLALFQTVQSSLASEQLQILRITEKRYDVIISTLQHLLSAEDIVQIASILFEYRVIFPSGGLSELTNYLKEENLDTKILKEHSDIVHIIGEFLGNHHLTPHNVSSMVGTLNRFGGRGFVNSLQRIATLTDIHPEYGAILDLLKNADASDQIEKFLIWLRLTEDIRSSHPHETDFEQLKRHYVINNLNMWFQLDMKSLDEYFYLEISPRRRKMPRLLSVPENLMEDDEDVFNTCND